MFKKFNHLAEAAATNVSRRQMLGRFGRAAAAAAAVLAGLLPSQAEAGRGLKRPRQCRICSYQCPDGSVFSIVRSSGGCQKSRNDCTLFYSTACDQSM